MSGGSLLFHIPPYEALARKLAKRASLKPGLIEYRRFPDGERYLRIQSEVHGKDVTLLGGTIDDTSTLDLFDLATGLVSAGCRSMTLLIPYFGYSTMERTVRKGEIVTAKSRARLLSAIPLAPFGNRVALLDLHSDGIPFYFEGGVSPSHLYAKPLILAQARKLGGKSFVLGSVDAGRAKWVESLANDLGVNVGFVYKRRLSGKETEISGVNVTVKGSRVVLYDDMIRTGGSVIHAAEAYLAEGARSVAVICTHGLFSDGGLERLRKSGAIERIVCTDSHPDALRQQAAAKGFLEVVSTDALFSAFLKGRHFETH